MMLSKEDKIIKKLSIIWPSGKTGVFSDIETNKKYEIFENEKKLYQITFKKLNFTKKTEYNSHQNH